MGVLRIFFTSEDLARTRIARNPDPLWELVMSIHKIHTSTGGLAFQPWRRMVRATLAQQPPQARQALLRHLVPRQGDFPDFLTPTEGLLGLDPGIDAMMRTPRDRLNADIGFIAQQRSLPSWAHDLAAGSPRILQAVSETMRTYHDTVLRPFWPTVQAHIDADRAHRARAFLNGGCEALLASFRPTLRWNRPILAARYPVDYDVHLEGRGLTLIPNYFCWGNPVTLIDRSCPTPVLVYPIDHDLTLTATTAPITGGSDKRLAALLGRTRSQILITLANMHTTGELARRFQVSPATISQHTTILRDAGLITTRRDANTALHIITPLGATLCHVGS